MTYEQPSLFEQHFLPIPRHPDVRLGASLQLKAFAGFTAGPANQLRPVPTTKLRRRFRPSV